MRRCALAITLAAIGIAAWPARPAGAQAPLLGRPAPEIAGGPWINSPPLTLTALKGRVVCVEFWTSG